MAGNFSRRSDGFGDTLPDFSDARLYDAVRDYVWLAECGPVPARGNYTDRVAALVAECDRRGSAEIVTMARASLLPHDDKR